MPASALRFIKLPGVDFEPKPPLAPTDIEGAVGNRRRGPTPPRMGDNGVDWPELLLLGSPRVLSDAAEAETGS